MAQKKIQNVANNVPIFSTKTFLNPLYTSGKIVNNIIIKVHLPLVLMEFTGGKVNL